MNKVLLSSETNEWYTPKHIFKQIENLFEINFTLDPCATKESTKCELYYTKEDNGLTKSWKGEYVFINPPYSRDLQPKFIKKAFLESIDNNTMCVLLIPSRTDTKIMHEYIFDKATRIIFIEGRIKFDKPNDEKTSAKAPFPSMLVLFNGYCNDPIIIERYKFKKDGEE